MRFKLEDYMADSGAAIDRCLESFPEQVQAIKEGAATGEVNKVVQRTRALWACSDETIRRICSVASFRVIVGAKPNEAELFEDVSREMSLRGMIEGMI